MKDPEKSGFAEGHATEVELDAQELLELSEARAIEQSGHWVEPRTIEEPAGRLAVASAQPTPIQNTRSSADRRMSAPRIALAFSIVVAAVTVISAQYKHSAPEHPLQSSLRIASQDTALFDKPEPAAEIEHPPILFANPFDDSEVFEFPPGTSEAEVRAAVGDLLIKRATERQGPSRARPIQ